MMDQADGCGGYHEPMLGMVVGGPASGSARPAGGGSMEMPWGVRMKAMRPSRGGRGKPNRIPPTFTRVQAKAITIAPSDGRGPSVFWSVGVTSWTTN